MNQFGNSFENLQGVPFPRLHHTYGDGNRFIQYVIRGAGKNAPREAIMDDRDLFRLFAAHPSFEALLSDLPSGTNTRYVVYLKPPTRDAEFTLGTPLASNIQVMKDQPEEKVNDELDQLISAIPPIPQNHSTANKRSRQV